MNQEVFADTNFWIAIFDERDSLHDTAGEAITALPRTCRLVTSQIIFSEVFELFAKRSGFIKEQITNFVADIVNDSSVILEPSTPKLFDATVSFYRKHSDKEWGFVDCSSFVIMKRRAIKEALTYDRHFIQAGFKALLRD
jgi:predicted nucleic acid-binding protein